MISLNGEMNIKNCLNALKFPNQMSDHSESKKQKVSSVSKAGKHSNQRRSVPFLFIKGVLAKKYETSGLDKPIKHPEDQDLYTGNHLVVKQGGT